jgi:hypothetical protein
MLRIHAEMKQVNVTWALACFVGFGLPVAQFACGAATPAEGPETGSAREAGTGNGSGSGSGTGGGSGSGSGAHGRMDAGIDSGSASNPDAASGADSRAADASTSDGRSTADSFSDVTMPPTTHFDYFIAPSGDDNNAGTLASPWSITALNSKMSTYSGKNVCIIGDIAGTQTAIQHGTVGGVQTTLYALAQSQPSGDGPSLKINGGTSTASTYLTSCNSAGAYTPRWAIIDFSDPVGGALPSVEALSMGQSFYNVSAVPNAGYTTVDALTIQNFNYAALAFSDLGGNTMLGIVIKNCDIHTGTTATSADNPGAILLAGAIGAVITNNKIYDLQTQGGGASPMWGFSAVRIYGIHQAALALVATHNTFYDCSSILTKDANSDFADCSYNYLDHGSFGSAGSTDSDLGMGSIVGQTPYAGVTSLIHHNIMLGNLGMRPQSSGQTVTGTMKFYNNTLYGSPNWTTQDFIGTYCQEAAGAAAIQFYNNIVYAVNGYNDGAGAMLIESPYAVSNATFNNNVYGSNSNGISFARTEYTPLSLAAWKSATGCDQNSVLVSSSPFSGTPTAQVPSSFAAGSSAVIGGVTAGGLDGSGPIGCNF